MPDLPARSGADARLAAAFTRSGCPLCRVRADRERTYIGSLLAEFVNDIEFRRRLDEARGFCESHVHALIEADRRGSGGLVGPAILFHAFLRARLKELAAAHSARGRTRSKRLVETARPPRCPICSEVRQFDLVAVAGLPALTADPAWADAVAAAPFCLEHLLALMAVGPATASWSAIEARQVGRLRELGERLESFIHRSSHDRRHTITDADRASASTAANVLGGDRPIR